MQSDIWVWSSAEKLGLEMKLLELLYSDGVPSPETERVYHGVRLDGGEGKMHSPGHLTVKRWRRGPAAETKGSNEAVE